MTTPVPAKAISPAIDAHARVHAEQQADPANGKQDELLDLYGAIMIAVPLAFLLKWMWS